MTTFKPTSFTNNIPALKKPVEISPKLLTKNEKDLSVKLAAVNEITACECENHGVTCSELYNCCNCGFESDGCGCAYCFSCQACEFCLNED